MIFGINTTCDISKLSQILKYHSWYLCQISLQIMLLPIQSPSEIKSVRWTLSKGGRLMLPWVPETFLARFPVSLKSL